MHWLSRLTTYKRCFSLKLYCIWKRFSVSVSHKLYSLFFTLLDTHLETCKRVKYHRMYQMSFRSPPFRVCFRQHWLWFLYCLQFRLKWLSSFEFLEFRNQSYGIKTVADCFLYQFSAHRDIVHCRKRCAQENHAKKSYSSVLQFPR